MGSPFKMSPKTPFMKALVGKQKNLPEHLKQAILDAPAKKTDKTKGKRLSEKEVANFKSDMGKYSPTITSSEKTLGGPSQGPPATDLEGNIKKAGSKLARGGKVLSTKDVHPSGKRQSKTRQRVRQVTYSDSPAKMTDNKKKKSTSKTVDINKPVKNPAPGTAAYAKQSKGKGSKTFGEGGREIIVSEENKKKYAERRKQKAAERRKKLGLRSAY